MKQTPNDILHILAHSPLPEWAAWLAQDSDGSWWAYRAEPLQNYQGWYENEIGVFKRLGQGTPPKDWTVELYKTDCVRAQIR